MMDYSKINEYELKMAANTNGYLKFMKAFFDSQLGMRNSFTEEEFHQAIEHQKALVKKNIEESNLSDDYKEQKKNEVEAAFSCAEEYLKNHYFVRIR